MKLNPYIAGNPVGGGDAFIGRADVLREVVRVLRSPNQNAIVLFGQRRIGKTSVLQELAARLPVVGPYRPVFFDLQDKAALPLASVLQELAARIAERLGLPLHAAWVEDMVHAFREEFIPEILIHLPPDTSLVLLFDEFDVLDNLGEVQAGAAFFPYLRDLLALDPRLQFIFVIGRRPEDMSSLTLSVFKGVKSRSVSLMSPEETAKLVRLAERNNTLRWSDEAIAQVYSLTGGHPFLIQQLCQEVWEQSYQDESMEPSIVSSTEVETAAPLALRSATNALEWLWDGLKPAQRVVASALAGAGPMPISQRDLEQRLLDSGVRILIDELQDAPRVLQEWDLIEPVEERYHFRVELLRRWLAERKPLPVVQKEIDQILPVAENLFQAAFGFYQGGNLEQSIMLLRQATGINPNHLRANQLLAELLLAQRELTAARQLLESLYQYHPNAARSRLVQVLLLQAQELKNAVVSNSKEDDSIPDLGRLLTEAGRSQESATERQPKSVLSAKDWLIASTNEVIKRESIDSELFPQIPFSAASIRQSTIKPAESSFTSKSDKRSPAIEMLLRSRLITESPLTTKENQLLTIYDQVLELEPNQPEAIAGRRQIWEGRGDIALGIGNLEEALQAYLRVDVREKAQKVKRLIELGSSSLYRQTLTALESGDKQKVQRLLAQIVLSEGVDVPNQQKAGANYQEDLRLLKNLQDQLDSEREARQKAESISRYEVDIRRRLELEITNLDKYGKRMVTLGIILIILMFIIIYTFALFVFDRFFVKN